MLLRDIKELLSADVLCCEDMLDSVYVESVYASDMMSDVLSQVLGSPVLLTGLCNPQVIRTAEMMDISCVVFVRDKSPDSNLIELAIENNICVLQTSMKMFVACGVLYGSGLYGEGLQ